MLTVSNVVITCAAVMLRRCEALDVVAIVDGNKKRGCQLQLPVAEELELDVVLRQPVHNGVRAQRGRRRVHAGHDPRPFGEQEQGALDQHDGGPPVRRLCARDARCDLSVGLRRCCCCCICDRLAIVS